MRAQLVWADSCSGEGLTIVHLVSTMLSPEYLVMLLFPAKAQLQSGDLKTQNTNTNSLNCFGSLETNSGLYVVTFNQNVD